jgi:hypothetical protein
MMMMIMMLDDDDDDDNDYDNGDGGSTSLLQPNYCYDHFLLLSLLLSSFMVAGYASSGLLWRWLRDV